MCCDKLVVTEDTYFLRDGERGYGKLSREIQCCLVWWRGGNVGVAGIVINKDDGTGEAQAWAAEAGIPVLASIPADDDIRRKSAAYTIIGKPGGTWAPLFEELATNVAEAPPMRPKPLTQDGLLGLFSSDAVGRNVVLEPATLEDMCEASSLAKPSLEVIYDDA